MENQFSNSLKTVLSKMCEMVGISYDAIDFSDERWYIKCDWTIEEQNMFKKWLTDYLYNDTKARNELMNHPIKKKKYCEKVADEFCWQYGWRNCE